LQPPVTRIQLCGTLSATIGGRRIEQELPGRQGRPAFAYLVSTRTRPSTRPALIEALWPANVPTAAAATQELHKDLLATHNVGVS